MVSTALNCSQMSNVANLCVRLIQCLLQFIFIRVKRVHSSCLIFLQITYTFLEVFYDFFVYHVDRTVFPRGISSASASPASTTSLFIPCQPHQLVSQTHIIILGTSPIFNNLSLLNHILFFIKNLNS